MTKAWQLLLDGTDPPPTKPADPIRGRRRRLRTQARRTTRLNLRLSAAEAATVAEAAGRLGLAPAAYAADRLLQVAAGELTPLPVDLADRLRAVLEARVEAQRLADAFLALARAHSGSGIDMLAQRADLCLAAEQAEHAALRLDRAAGALAAQVKQAEARRAR